MSKQKKSVHPSVYTKEYYLTDCMGYAEFQKSYGNQLEIRFQEVIKRFRIIRINK